VPTARAIGRVIGRNAIFRRSRLRQPRKRSWTACWTVRWQRTPGRRRHIKCGSVMGVVHPGLRHFFETFMRDLSLERARWKRGKPRALSPLVAV